jgi:hypothetical protein
VPETTAAQIFKAESPEKRLNVQKQIESIVIDNEGLQTSLDPASNKSISRDEFVSLRSEVAQIKELLLL